MVRETPRLETEGTRRLPYYRQGLAGAFPGREARLESLLLQHRELRSSRCGRETQSRRPHAQARRRACVFCRSGRHRMSGRECVIRLPKDRLTYSAPLMSTSRLDQSLCRSHPCELRRNSLTARARSLLPSQIYLLCRWSLNSIRVVSLLLQETRGVRS